MARRVGGRRGEGTGSGRYSVVDGQCEGAVVLQETFSSDVGSSSYNLGASQRKIGSALTEVGLLALQVNAPSFQLMNCQGSRLEQVKNGKSRQTTFAPSWSMFLPRKQPKSYEMRVT